jgi:peptidoglycan/LPS O-acetylase OafA/YrhL
VSTSHRINAFDALRLLGALLVILGHGFILSGHLDELPVVGGLAVNVMGVVIFFTISGYLIWKSWYSSSTWQSFTAARFLRIVPALAVVVLLTALVMGPLVTTLAPGDYFVQGETWRYLTNIFIVDPQYQLPGVFGSQPVSDAVNGSLWTLRAELLCYVAVPVTALLPRAWRKFVLAPVGIWLIWFGLTSSVFVLDSNLTMAGFYWGFFALGAFAAEIKFRPRFAPVIAIALAAAWLLLTSSTAAVLDVAGLICFAGVVMTVGLMNIPVIRDAAKFGDLSYGIYLLAFPIQQLAFLFLPGLTIWQSMGLVTVVSAALAVALWWTIEARALRARPALAGWLRRVTTRPV